MPSREPEGRVTGRIARGARSLLVDTAPLRESPPFARLWAGTLVAGLGTQLTLVAVGLQVYAMTGSTFAVAMVGVVGLLPLIVAGLYGGMLADAFDRRKVLLISSLIAWASTIGLAVFALLGLKLLWLLYLITVVNAAAGAVVHLTRTAIVPRLIRADLIPAAAALGGISMGLSFTVGPALAGVLVGTIGFAATYFVDVVLFLFALAAALSLPQLLPEGEVHAPGLSSIRSGLAYLRTATVVRVSFIADIAAMALARPNALFPAVAATVVGGGAFTVGAFTSAFAIGALALSLMSGRLLGVQRQGVAVGWSIAAYGASIGAFGAMILLTGVRGVGASLAPVAFVCGLVCLFAAGASDQASAIFRTTILQTAAPDNMRGRLQGIFTVVVNGGPRLGDLFVGTLATLGALWLPPLLGGFLLILVIGLILRAYGAFRLYRAGDASGAQQGEAEAEGVAEVSG